VFDMANKTHLHQQMSICPYQIMPQLSISKTLLQLPSQSNTASSNSLCTKSNK
jgi:hypothetical protein